MLEVSITGKEAETVFNLLRKAWISGDCTVALDSFMRKLDEAMNAERADAGR